jgi:hypothetical protein
VPGDGFDPTREIAAADDYENRRPVVEDLPVKPR